MNESITEILKEKGDELKRNFFLELLDDYAVKHSLNSDTARAFHRKKCYNNFKPTSIFKNWAHNYLTKENGIKNILISNDFKALHTDCIDRLRKRWFALEPEVKNEMPYYLFPKMIDLFFKRVLRWNEIPNKRREWLFSNVHVPIDKYAILALSKFHPDYNENKPSMRFVQGENHYFKIQADIAELVAPYPPIMFDIYAYDYLRLETIRKEETYELEEAEKK